MTPTDFEAKAREASSKFAYETTYIPTDVRSQFDDERVQAFQQGAQWSRTETIAEMLGMLRSSKAEFDLPDFDLEVGDVASWLERELQKDAPKAKEGCHSDFQNG